MCKALCKERRVKPLGVDFSRVLSAPPAAPISPLFARDNVSPSVRSVGRRLLKTVLAILSPGRVECRNILDAGSIVCSRYQGEGIARARNKETRRFCAGCPRDVTRYDILIAYSGV